MPVAHVTRRVSSRESSHRPTRLCNLLKHPARPAINPVASLPHDATQVAQATQPLPRSRGSLLGLRAENRRKRNTLHSFCGSLQSFQRSHLRFHGQVDRHKALLPPLRSPHLQHENRPLGRAQPAYPHNALLQRHNAPLHRHDTSGLQHIIPLLGRHPPLAQHITPDRGRAAPLHGCADALLRRAEAERARHAPESCVA